MKECINYQADESGGLRCNTCEHRCKIEDGNVGICGVRKNVGGKLCLLTYGTAVAAHVDPMEKKPLFHFLPGCKAYSYGTVGCNLHCGNCQNFDISQMFGAKRNLSKYDSLRWGYKMEPETIIEDALANNCSAVAYTYNEPTISVEYMLDTMKLAREAGLKNVWVSNGYMTEETLDAIDCYLDAVNVDIKSFDNDFYRKHCGAGIEPILRNCRTLVRNEIWLEITTLIIPTLSDNIEMLKKIARFIRDELGVFVPWQLSAFAGEISWKMQDISATSLEKIQEAKSMGMREGLKYVYGGNVPDSSMENTLCPKCKKVFIQRTGYEIRRMGSGGVCSNCGEKIEGVF